MDHKHIMKDCPNCVDPGGCWCSSCSCGKIHNCAWCYRYIEGQQKDIDVYCKQCDKIVIGLWTDNELAQ